MLWPIVLLIIVTLSTSPALLKYSFIFSAFHSFGTFFTNTFAEKEKREGLKKKRLLRVEESIKLIL